MRKHSHPTKEIMTLAKVLHALSDPARLFIVQSLAANGEQACKAFYLPMAKSTASHHFRVLREAGVIHMRPDGTQYITSLRRDDLNSLFPNLLEVVLQASEPINIKK